MPRLIALFTLMLTAVVSANAQNLQSVSSVRDNENVWTYSVTRQGSAAPLTVRLAIPASARVEGLTSPREATLRLERLGTGNLIRITFEPISTPPDASPPEKETFTFEVIASQNVTTTGAVDWTIEASPNNITGTASGPAVLYDPSTLRPVFAAGGSWRRDDVVDFTIADGVMLIENDSSMRPSAVAGVLVKLVDFQTLFGWRMAEKKTLDFLVSLEFAHDTSKTLDGFVFGLGLGVNRYLEFYGGVSVRTGQEVRFGFRKAAKQLAREIHGLPDTKENRRIKSDFERFRMFNTDERFDGFSTISPITQEPIFPGSPLVSSTNSAWVFGVALPVDIFNLIRGQ